MDGPPSTFARHESERWCGREELAGAIMPRSLSCDFMRFCCAFPRPRLGSWRYVLMANSTALSTLIMAIR